MIIFHCSEIASISVANS